MTPIEKESLVNNSGAETLLTWSWAPELKERGRELEDAARFATEARRSEMSNPAKSTWYSRRTILIAAASAGPVLAISARSARAAKLSQKAAKYQDSPKDGKQCDGCNLFVAPNACKSVDGTISPKGWCALWIKKAG